MESIKFIGREKELESIRKMDGNFFLVVKGRRRIGKTMLLKKAFPEAVYIFVWPDKSIGWICQEICKENNLPEFRNFKDIINYLFDRNKTVILDEFQNFLNVDKSVYGEIQKIIDDRKGSKTFFRLAVAGSSYSLMNKAFNDSASPLYGRRTNEIVLGSLPIAELFMELGLPLEEFVKLWAVFEGVPYYYELIDRKIPSEANIKNLVVSRNAQLSDEGKAILSVEFGRDSKTYNTVISAIAGGKTKLNEIAGLFGNKKNEVVKYLDILRKDFNIIRKMTPVTENPGKSREGRYGIIDNFLCFWFLFADKQRSLAEQERFKEIGDYFEDNFNAYLGKMFEKFIGLLLKDNIVLAQKEFDKIGGQWGKFEGEKGKNSYEIDVLALNEKTREALFAECKWKENADAGKILKELAEKSKHVSWRSKDRDESFAVFAKSFRKRITSFEGKKVHCLDFKDISGAIKKQGQKGILRRAGPDKGGHWELKEGKGK